MRPTINGKDTAPKNPKAMGRRSLTDVLSNYRDRGQIEYKNNKPTGGKMRRDECMM